MSKSLTSLWRDFIRLFFQRPKRLQVAALCYRGKGADMEVLLVTSWDTGRWIIPKGWPISGLKTSEAALQEAWEEAGVRNSEAPLQPIGTYSYDKVLRAGLPVPVETLVFPVNVKHLITVLLNSSHVLKSFCDTPHSSGFLRTGFHGVLSSSMSLAAPIPCHPSARFCISLPTFRWLQRFHARVCTLQDS